MLQRWASEIEGSVMLLFVGMIFFAVMLIFVEYRFQNDSVVFQAVSGILSGFAGAFFGIMTGKRDKNGTTSAHPPAPPAPAQPAHEPTA